MIKDVCGMSECSSVVCTVAAEIQRCLCSMSECWVKFCQNNSSLCFGEVLLKKKRCNTTNVLTINNFIKTSCDNC